MSETTFGFAPGDALLAVDVINDFDHDDGKQLLASFRARAAEMKQTISQARAIGIPVIYVNDDKGRWDSDAPALIRAAIDEPRSGEIIKKVAPLPGDHVLLKHRYSGFDHTPLDILLEQLQVERLVLIGAATEGCVVQTAIDAREHGLKATIIANACATTDADLEETALRYAERVVGVHIALTENAQRVATSGASG
jgi:nicotinamidase-related amidase